MPLSRDPDARRAQLANLRRAPAAPPGNARGLRHGLHTRRPGVHALGPAVAAVMADLEAALPEPLRDPRTGEAAAWARESVEALAVLKLALIRSERWVAAQEDKGGPGSVPLDVLDAQARLATRYRDALAEEAMTLRGRLRAGLDAARAVDLATAMSEPDPERRRVLLGEAGLLEEGAS